jgi:hypothetical protein
MFGFGNPHEGPKPFDIGFNAAVMTLATSACPRGWEVTDSFVLSPHSLADVTRLINLTGKPVIWSGASDNTIFGCAEHNYAFRAWHDALHYKHQTPFSLAGEAQTVYAQVYQLVRCYGDDDEVADWACMLLTEVIGQAEYNVRLGEFPLDQRVFMEVTCAQYKRLARLLVAEFADEDCTEEQAVKLAATQWGN